MTGVFSTLPRCLTSNGLKSNSHGFNPLNKLNTSKETLGVISQSHWLGKELQPTLRKQTFELFSTNRTLRVVTTTNNRANMKVASFIHQANSNHVDRRFTIDQVGGRPPKSVHADSVPHFSHGGCSGWSSWSSASLLSTNHTFKAVCQSQHLFSRPCILQCPLEYALTRMTQISVKLTQFPQDLLFIGVCIRARNY